MKLSRLSFFLTLFTIGLQAQTDTLRQAPAGFAEAALAREDATTALKTGNSQAALAKLRGAPRDGSLKEEVHVVASVALIARALAAELHPATRDTALLAIAEADKAKGRLTSSESAYIEAQVGELYERVLGDTTKAKEFYRLALARDASRKDAEVGLKRIERFEALDAAKARETAELRSRAK